MFNNPIEEVKERYKREYDRIFTNLMRAYPKRFRDLRQNAKFAYGMKQIEVAEILNSHPDVNIKRSMYSRLESGDITPPMKVFVAISALYEVTIGQAAGLEELSGSGDKKSLSVAKKYQEASTMEFSNMLKEVALYLNKEAKKHESGHTVEDDEAPES